jgi:hypothetical protein
MQTIPDWEILLIYVYLFVFPVEIQSPIQHWGHSSW